MKKTVLFIGFFLFLSSVYAQNKFQYGFSVGLRQSFATGLSPYQSSSTSNWQFGAKFILPLKNCLSLHILPNAHTQGWQDDAPRPLLLGSPNQVRVVNNRIDFLGAELPLMLAYHWDHKKMRFSGLAGVQYNYTAHVTLEQIFKAGFEEIDTRYDVTNRFKEHLWGVNVGASFQTLTRPAFFVDARYHQILNNVKVDASPSKILTSLNTDAVYLMGFSLSTGLLF